MTVLGLHGFTQRGSMWDEVASLDGGVWFSPDLPGHGEEPVRTWDETIAWVAERLATLRRPRVLAGYSMGGRIALGTTVARPELVDALVVVSATAGLRSTAERRRRIADDAILAESIRSGGVDAFLDEWLARAMFSGLVSRGQAWIDQDRSERSANSADGLAGALVALGQGSMPWLGRRIKDVVAPSTFVAGTSDDRYAAAARRMAAAVARGRVWMVPDTGHAVVGEDPRAVAAAVALARRTIG